MKKISLITFCSVFLTSCVPIDMEYRIYLKNNSNLAIWYWINFNFPDTLLPVSNINVYYLSAGNKCILVGNPDKWEEDFTNCFPSDTLEIVYFDPDTISKYNWETIKIFYKISSRLDYSKKYLVEHDWVISYP